MRRVLNLALFIIFAVLLAYAGLVALVYLRQNDMVYFPMRQLMQTPADRGLVYEDVWLQAADGTRLHAWFVPAPSARATVLFFHGNGGNIATVVDTAVVFHRLELNTLLLDYRGYGQSAGTPTEQGLYQDAEAAWRYLTEERQIPPDNLIVVGRSLGGGVASWLAQQHTPAALVLETTFTSLPDVGAKHYPFLPVRALARNRYPTIERLPHIDVPVLIVQSRDDTIIPFSHGERLYEAAQQPKRFVALRGEHNAAFLLSAAQYTAELDDFVTHALSTTTTTQPEAMQPER